MNTLSKISCERKLLVTLIGYRLSSRESWQGVQCRNLDAETRLATWKETLLLTCCVWVAKPALLYSPRAPSLSKGPSGGIIFSMEVPSFLMKLGRVTLTKQTNYPAHILPIKNSETIILYLYHYVPPFSWTSLGTVCTLVISLKCLKLNLSGGCDMKMFSHVLQGFSAH